MKLWIRGCYLLLAWGAAFFFGATISEELDPFDRSHQRCNTMPNLECVGLREHALRKYTVGEVVSEFTTRPFAEIQQLNGWNKGEVAPGTILPKGKMIVISGSI